jgi:hypothetical protein
VRNKIIDNLFVFVFALLLSFAVLSTISIIRAHASWGAEYTNADLGVQVQNARAVALKVVESPGLTAFTRR